MGKTRYQSSWKVDYLWVDKSPKSVNHAICVVYGTIINVSGGVTQLHSHQETDKHDKNKKKQQN